MEEKRRCFGDCDIYKAYHDNEWGRCEFDDIKLFEALCLDGAQAGLSWITILKKREGYRRAFDYFNPYKIALYDEKKIEELMLNKDIVRNRLKINAFITNAKVYITKFSEKGSFSKFLWSYVNNKPIQNQIEKYEDYKATSLESDKLSYDLKKLGFKFVGSTIVYAFMQAVGMVNDHIKWCFVYEELK